jgi:nucleotide-binding universal stress UspA family protein
MSETRSRSSEPDASTQAGRPIFSDILCAVDGTRRSYDAVEQAAALAAPGGRLTLLAATAERGSGIYRQAAISHERAERILVHARQLAHAAGADATTEIEPQGPVDEAILGHAASHELLALGAPSDGLGVIFTPNRVAGTALDSAQTALLLSRPVPASETRFAEHVLVASDGLEDSDELVGLAARLARARASNLTLVHAIGSESHSHPHRIEQQSAELERELAGVGAYELCVEPRGAAEAILAAAERARPSLIIAGTRHVHGLQVLGSVSRRVIHDAACSVLLVQPQR